MKKIFITLVGVLITLSSYAEIVSGECGAKLIWPLSNDYTLIIEGEGDMYDWSIPDEVPWDRFRSMIVKTTIGNKVTNIGNYAFSGCSSLTSMTIPNSVTSIGMCAFEGCKGLTSVTIPSSVTSIAEATFANCLGLTSITLPESITKIEEFTFAMCAGLTSVAIPNTVTSIGNFAFYDCSNLTSATVPNSVTQIDYFAFGLCSVLSTVTLGNSVAWIGDYAFTECENLRSFTIHAPAIPDANNDIFDNSSVSDATLYVPAKLLNYYKIRILWESFGAILPIDDSTKINEHAVNTHEGTWYDLSGRKTDDGGKGVMIMNGKKYVRR